MKLLLFFTFLALACLARSAPPVALDDRTLILPNYDADQEAEVDDNEDMEDEVVQTTTLATTIRSTYVFPTRARTTVTSRRPWLTQRMTTTSEYEADSADTDPNDVEHGFKFFKNIGEFFKRLLGDVKKFFQKIAENDIIKFIRQFFGGGSDD